MAEYLPLTVESAAERSEVEAQQRGAGLQPGDVSRYWHSWIVHPMTGQEALVVQDESDKEYFSAGEVAALLTQSEADDADWILSFEVTPNG